MLQIHLSTSENQTSSDIYDVIIIGSGPAGMAAAIYTGRSLLKTLMLEKIGSGGQAALTELIENYPGFPHGINGYELSQKMEEQAKNFGTSFDYAEVQKVTQDETGIFHVFTESREFLSKTVIIATGASPKKLGVPGEEKFIGRGISFCATCDASFYKDKVVAVVGGGDSAVEEGMYLTKFAKKVYLIHRRDQLRAAKIVQKRAFQTPGMEFIWDTVVEEIKGENFVEALKLKNVKTNETSWLEVNGVFLYIGLLPNTNFIEGVEKDEQGYIITDEMMRTNIPGLFAAGDCRHTPLRQVITAASDGAIAAYAVEKYLETLPHEKA
ncbi:thioredoxin-disulfide reductase [Thermospira aquatica]|uniref:Thioredoxin reductase n=1 Tax=Thermospira aquatica TaxID=2828656 RepID=A0AAX3BAN4_9SPIR|nr:thioredoxin-disulfide reductase [Thermospira aquatica]URA09320.1 thioredoxin-disulfide reductase [Thermospira aquatica]